MLRSKTHRTICNQFPKPKRHVTKLNTDALKSCKLRKKFETELSDAFDKEDETNQPDIEHMWKTFKETTTVKTAAVLGKQPRKNADWCDVQSDVIEPLLKKTLAREKLPNTRSSRLNASNYGQC